MSKTLARATAKTASNDHIVPVGENSIPLPVSPTDITSKTTQVVTERNNGQHSGNRAGETPI